MSIVIQTNRLSTYSSGLPIAHCLLPIAHCLSPIAYSAPLLTLTAWACARSPSPSAIIETTSPKAIHTYATVR